MGRSEKIKDLNLEETLHNLELMETVEILEKQLSEKNRELDETKRLLEKANESRFDFDRERLKRNPPRIEYKQNR